MVEQGIAEHVERGGNGVEIVVKAARLDMGRANQMADTVIDGHPATLGWLGSVHGHRTRSPGVEHFGQTGSIAELYRHYGIDARGIIQAAEALTPGKPIRNLRAV